MAIPMLIFELPHLNNQRVQKYIFYGIACAKSIAKLVARDNRASGPAEKVCPGYYKSFDVYTPLVTMLYRALNKCTSSGISNN